MPLVAFYLFFLVIAPLITGILLYRTFRSCVRKKPENEERRNALLHSPLIISLMIPATCTLQIFGYLSGRVGRRLSIDRPEDIEKLLQSIKFQALYSYAFAFAFLLAFICAFYLSFSPDDNKGKWQGYTLRFRLWWLIWSLAFLWYAVFEAYCGRHMCYI